ncbi:MAG: 30S ribosomal protein S3 [Candidatus Uhrbacteria bacterium]|nr:30S ribosomal protein S3 [Candidatus Uhrbacteria bacterium]
MGHKVNPKIFRTGILYGWDSKWFATGKQFRDNLAKDIALKKYLEKQLKGSSVSKVEIERTTHVITITIHSAKPGVIIGRQGAGIEELKMKIRKEFFGSEKVTVNVNVVEVDKPLLDSSLVMQGMIEELEKRMPYRRVMKQVIDRVSKGGAQGVKVRISGRLNGAEIANVETLHNGKIPLHTLRAHIDYSRGAAHTLSGVVGVKVWIYKGMNFGAKE